MKILFHSKTLNLRGVTNSIVDYANNAKKYLGAEVAIAYDASFVSKENFVNDVNTKPAVVDLLKKQFHVFPYYNQKELIELTTFADLVYTQNAGLRSEAIETETRTATHVAFCQYQPHGTKYAYVSEWLAQDAKREHKLDFDPEYVPLIVDLPQPDPTTRNKIRDALGIPRDAFVFGRHGGEFTFDLEFVYRAIEMYSLKNRNVYFLLANTYPVAKGDHIKQIKPFFGKQQTANFISVCDAMIHARAMGETFGLAICEFLFQGKPVLAWEQGTDSNHVVLLKDQNMLYNKDNIMDKLDWVVNTNFVNQKLQNIVKPFSPEIVMPQFKKVFLD